MGIIRSFLVFFRIEFRVFSFVYISYLRSSGSVLLMSFIFFRMDDNLVKLWKNLSLTGIEQSNVQVEDDWLQSTIDCVKNCLVAKLFHRRNINVEVLKNALLKIWRLKLGHVDYWG